MYEMLTGTPPYHRGDHMSVMYQHVQGKARPPIELNPALPPGISDLVMQCMSVDKAKRFSSRWTSCMWRSSDSCDSLAAQWRASTHS